MLYCSVLAQAGGGGGSRAGAWANDGGVVVTSDSDSLLPVVTTSLSRIGVEGILVRDWK